MIALQPCKAYSTQNCTCSDLRPLTAASSCLLHFWLQGDWGGGIFQPKWLPQDATKSSNPCPSQAFGAWGKGLENSPAGSKHPQRCSNLHNRQEGRGCAEANERCQALLCYYIGDKYFQGLTFKWCGLAGVHWALQTDTEISIFIQENGLCNLRYQTQLDNETLGTPWGIFFSPL